MEPPSSPFIATYSVEKNASSPEGATAWIAVGQSEAVKGDRWSLDGDGVLTHTNEGCAPLAVPARSLTVDQQETVKRYRAARDKVVALRSASTTYTEVETALMEAIEEAPVSGHFMSQGYDGYIGRVAWLSEAAFGRPMLPPVVAQAKLPELYARGAKGLTDEELKQWAATMMSVVMAADGTVGMPEWMFGAVMAMPLVLPPHAQDPNGAWLKDAIHKYAPELEQPMLQRQCDKVRSVMQKDLGMLLFVFDQFTQANGKSPDIEEIRSRIPRLRTAKFGLYDIQASIVDGNLILKSVGSKAPFLGDTWQVDGRDLVHVVDVCRASDGKPGASEAGTSTAAD